MKIFVSVKMVPDVTAPMQIKNGELILDVDRTVLNAYDASAVEEALDVRSAWRRSGGRECGTSEGCRNLEKPWPWAPIRGIFQRKQEIQGLIYIVAKILAAFYRDQRFNALFW